MPRKSPPAKAAKGEAKSGPRREPQAPTPAPAPVPKSRLGRPRREPEAGGTAPEKFPVKTKKIKGEFAKSLIRLRAAAMLLAGPLPPAKILAANLSKHRETVLAQLISPWFTIEAGRYKLTQKGRDEYVEAMDGQADVPETVGPAADSARRKSARTREQEEAARAEDEYTRWRTVPTPPGWV